jgi:hypothetical protein
MLRIIRTRRPFPPAHAPQVLASQEALRGLSKCWTSSVSHAEQLFATFLQRLLVGEALFVAAAKNRGGERRGKVGAMIPAGVVDRGERRRPKVIPADLGPAGFRWYRGHDLRTMEDAGGHPVGATAVASSAFLFPRLTGRTSCSRNILMVRPAAPANAAKIVDRPCIHSHVA